MKETQTPFGTVTVGSKVELYESFVGIIKSTIASVNYPPGVALTGGSSPKAFFEWLAANPDKLPEAKNDVVFTVSDERYVPEDSDESNYGNALRLFFEPFGVDIDNRFPWDTARIPSEAADWYQKLWELSFGEDATYDICMLGMGEDCHTASLFPSSPLLEGDFSDGPNFANVLVPEKGERLTITPRGLSKCGKIVVIAMGKGKAEPLKTVFHGEGNELKNVPISLLKNYHGKVIWLLDEEAASLLNF